MSTVTIGLLSVAWAAVVMLVVSRRKSEFSETLQSIQARSEDERRSVERIEHALERLEQTARHGVEMLAAQGHKAEQVAEETSAPEDISKIWDLMAHSMRLWRHKEERATVTRLTFLNLSKEEDVQGWKSDFVIGKAVSAWPPRPLTDPVTVMDSLEGEDEPEAAEDPRPPIVH